MYLIWFDHIDNSNQNRAEKAKSNEPESKAQRRITESFNIQHQIHLCINILERFEPTNTEYIMDNARY